MDTSTRFKPVEDGEREDQVVESPNSRDEGATQSGSLWRNSTSQFRGLIFITVNGKGEEIKIPD